jgi:hypothetical protein
MMASGIKAAIKISSMKQYTDCNLSRREDSDRSVIILDGSGELCRVLSLFKWKGRD